jgi:UDP-glucuronate 4-epimerase
VVGLDNLNDYYDPQLKLDRLARLTPHAGFRFVKMDVEDRDGMARCSPPRSSTAWCTWPRRPACATRCRTRTPTSTANIVGFMNILEGCRHNGVQHLVYASSSACTAATPKMPFSEHDSVDHPVSLYAATKKANELMAHTYSHLFGLPTTGLRFFTVYGPWGRPDMALFLFTKAILEGEPIDVFNHGKMVRDFTYIDDIAEGVVRVLDRINPGDKVRTVTKITKVVSGDTPQTLERWPRSTAASSGRRVPRPAASRWPRPPR